MVYKQLYKSCTRVY